MSFTGFLVLNKPLGITSAGCLRVLKQLLPRELKVGHSGTLDPGASGVLPAALGRATKLIPYLPGGKQYVAKVRCGVQTFTDDAAGDVLSDVDASAVTLEDVQAVLPSFVGNVTQRPPRVSAVHVGGKRAYKRARSDAGFNEMDIPERSVRVDRLEALNWKRHDRHPELVLRVDCGPGVYIRSIARDVGRRLVLADGTVVGGSLASLARTRSNGFGLPSAVTPEQLSQDGVQPHLLPPDVPFHHLPATTLRCGGGCRRQPDGSCPLASPSAGGIGGRLPECMLKNWRHGRLARCNDPTPSSGVACVDARTHGPRGGQLVRLYSPVDTGHDPVFCGLAEVATVSDAAVAAYQYHAPPDDASVVVRSVVNVLV